MKKLIATLILLTITGSILNAQQKDSTATSTAQVAPYLRFPTLPPFRLLGLDSTSIYSKDHLQKNRPVLLLVFSPGCDHCKYEAEQLVRRASDFKKIQVVMASTAPLSEIKGFHEQYNLNAIQGLIIGNDYQAILPGFYMLSNLPFHALYNKKGKLLTTFEGSVTLEKVLIAFD